MSPACMCHCNTYQSNIILIPYFCHKLKKGPHSFSIYNASWGKKSTFDINSCYFIDYSNAVWCQFPTIHSQFQLCTLAQRLVLLSALYRSEHLSTWLQAVHTTQIFFDRVSHGSPRSKCFPGASALRETRVCGHMGNRGEQKMKRGEGVGVRRKRSISR